MFAVRDEDVALDIVQDAMLKLTETYADRPAAEFPLEFHRILQNTIHDHFRRQKVRSTWYVLMSALGQRDDKEDDYDPLETLAAKMRIFRVPEFLASSFLLAVIGMLVHILLAS